jgi:hypothetical protein
MSELEPPDVPPPGWTFRIEEVSNLVWRAVGRDESGHEVERTGFLDEDEALREAWLAARWIDKQLGHT